MNNLVIFITIMFIPLICYLLLYFLVFGNKKKSSKEESGFEIARKLLDNGNLNNMYIVEARGVMNDEYDFNQHVIRLSTPVFHQNNLSSIAISSFYANIALMDKENDSYLKMKSMFKPVTDFLLIVAVLLVLVGSLFNMSSLSGLSIAIILIVLIVNGAMVAIHFNINKRVLDSLVKNNLIDVNEVNEVKQLLSIYAFNSIASMIDGLANLIVNSSFSGKIKK